MQSSDGKTNESDAIPYTSEPAVLTVLERVLMRVNSVYGVLQASAGFLVAVIFNDDDYWWHRAQTAVSACDQALCYVSVVLGRGACIAWLILGVWLIWIGRTHRQRPDALRRFTISWARLSTVAALMASFAGRAQDYVNSHRWTLESIPEMAGGIAILYGYPIVVMLSFARGKEGGQG